MSADSWFTPGRPEHPDFLVIADLLLAADAASAEGSFEEYLAKYSTLSVKRLTDIAMQEASSLINSHPDAPIVGLMEAAWAIGFAAGVRVSTGAPQPTANDLASNPDKVAYGGADPYTIRYIAHQRCLRLPRLPDTQKKKIISAAGAWLDAVLAGLRFPERKGLIP